MRRGADTRRRHAELARIGLGIGDELRNGLGRKGWSHLKGESLAADACNQLNVASEIVVELFVECRIDRALNADQEERVPISGRFNDRLDGDDAAGAGSIVNYKWLA